MLWVGVCACVKRVRARLFGSKYVSWIREFVKCGLLNEYLGICEALRVFAQVIIADREHIDRHACFVGGDRLRFGDVITAVATLTIIHILLETVLFAAIIPVNSLWGPDIAMIVSLLVASLVVGYLFAGKIYEESRRGAIVRIAVLSTVVLMLVILASMSNPYVGPTITEELERMYPTSGWTTADWLAYSQMFILLLVSMYVVLALVLDFIGLYVGSMLRKPKKS